MKLHPETPADRAKYMVAIGLAALLTASPAFAQTSDDSVRRLQEENAALRRQLAQAQGQAQSAPVVTQQATPVQTVPGTRSTVSQEPVDPDTLVLSPFQVKSDKDYGYLKTNSATATRINAEIQKVPLAISVIGSEFIQDAGIRDIQDVLRYVSSSTGDPRMGLRQPGNSATPSGTMTLRGFPISQRLRNGVFRYTGYSLDNVERVEIIKGPAAIFYGVGYPGGVINYVTKKPSFTKVPTTMSYGYGGEGDNVGDQRATLDHNIVLNDKTAFRIVGGWDNMKGDKNFEYDKGFTISPSMTIKPFKNDRLVITAEYEHMQMRRNQDDGSWIWNPQYFEDYKNPSASLLTAAGINPNDPNAKSIWQGRMGLGGSADAFGRSYGKWVEYKRTELNNPYWASYQTAARGAFYNDLNGNRIHDKKFNYYGNGAYTDQKVDTLELTVDASPFEWLDARYVVTRANAKFESLTNNYTPLFNGNEFFGASPAQRGDFRDAVNNQLDLVFKKDFFGIKHKLLTGGLISVADQRYTGVNRVLYANIPGAAQYDPTKPTNGTTNIPPWLNVYSYGLASQTLKDRYGNKLDAYSLFARYDPSLHPAPDVSRITGIDRGIVDAGRPKNTEYYVNYQADLLKDRLHFMGGYRWTKQDSNGGQRASSNPPWYNGQGYLSDAVGPGGWDAYGIGNGAGYTPWIRDAVTGAYTPNPAAPATGLGSYYQGTFTVNKGTSYMLGAAYDLTPDVTVYVSRSQSFRPTNASGAIYDIAGLTARANMLGLNAANEIARVRAEGADTLFGNEEGINTEFGLKTSLWNNKLVTTISFFRLDRVGEALDDILRQQADPLNYTQANKGGTFTTGAYTDPVTSQGTSGVRWYSNGTKRRVEGFEFEAIWTPVRNYQLVTSGSWLWKAKTLLNTSIDPVATTAAAVAARHYNYDFRMPGAPEYRFNVFNKYTFDTGVTRGLSVALGARYSSEIIIANSNEYDAKNGGLTGGNYVVFDGNLSYPWEVGGFRITTSLNVTNLTNKDYVEGGGGFGNAGSGVGYSFSPPRTWMLTNTLSF